MIVSWATRILSSLFCEEDVDALLGDLCEEYEHRSKAAGPRVAGIYCFREVYRSITCAARLRIVEVLRCAPWGVAMGSYLLAGVSQIGLTLILSPIWPEVAQTTSAWGIVTVSSESAGMFYRERYEVEDGDNWVLRVDISTDGGKSWDETQEIRLQRVQ